jgi:hypothetical protein
LTPLTQNNSTTWSTRFLESLRHASEARTDPVTLAS